MTKSLLVATTILTTTLLSEPFHMQEPMQGYIFVGDSRTVGMSLAVEETALLKFVGKVGAGITYIPEAQKEVEKIMEKAPDVKWTVIYNLGVNDLGNVEKYAEVYEDMDLEYSDFAVMSVNPVIDGKSNAYTSQVENFNSVMESKDFTFIDTYSEIKDSFVAPDGLHYNADTYVAIYESAIEILTEGKDATK